MRGVKDRPESCGSNLVISDFEDAVSFAIEHGTVDPNKIWVFGSSGGGYTGLCVLQKSRVKIQKIQVWNSITDLESWFKESYQPGLRGGKSKTFAHKLLQATASKSEQDLNVIEMQTRSPLYMPLPWSNIAIWPQIELFVGIYDGLSGAVSASQTLVYYNYLVRAYASLKGDAQSSLIDEGEIFQILHFRTLPSVNSNLEGDLGTKQWVKSYGPISPMVFIGGHEVDWRIAKRFLQSK